MKTATMNALSVNFASEGSRAATTRSQFLSRLKEELSCWTATRADLARMQREDARKYHQGNGAEQGGSRVVTA